MHSSIEVTVLWGCLWSRFFSIKFFFHKGGLSLRFSSIEVIFHWGCHPYFLNTKYSPTSLNLGLGWAWQNESRKGLCSFLCLTKNKVFSLLLLQENCLYIYILHNTYLSVHSSCTSYIVWYLWLVGVYFTLLVIITALITPNNCHDIY